MVDEKVIINNLKLEYITKKTDNYNNEQVHFKVLKGQDNKFTSINKENHTLPYFITEDKKMLLKVKRKYVKIDDLNKDMTYICDLELKYYKMENVEGFYINKMA